jgi:hypothetical protein
MRLLILLALGACLSALVSVKAADSARTCQFEKEVLTAMKFMRELNVGRCLKERELDLEEESNLYYNESGDMITYQEVLQTCHEFVDESEKNIHGCISRKILTL